MVKRKRYRLKKKGHIDGSSSVSAKGSVKKPKKQLEGETVTETTRIGQYAYAVDRSQSQTEKFQSVKDSCRRPTLQAATLSDSQRAAMKALIQRPASSTTHSKAAAELNRIGESKPPQKKLIKLFFAEAEHSSEQRRSARWREARDSVADRLKQHVAKEFMRQDMPILASRHLLTTNTLQL